VADARLTRNALLLERCEPGRFLSESDAERGFSAASIVRSFELGHSKRDALYRLDRLTCDLGLCLDVHVATVRWFLGEA
jgi:hypothetical protein